MKVPFVVLALAGATFAQDRFLITYSNNASLNEKYASRANRADLCAIDKALPCLKTSQVFISDGSRARDYSPFKLRSEKNQWAQDQVTAGIRPADAPTLYALYTAPAPSIMRKLALLRNDGEKHYNLIEVTLKQDDLSYSYKPSDGALSWDSFKIDLRTSQISVETPGLRWGIATLKGKSSPKNIALWDGSVNDKYDFAPITLALAAEGA